LVLLAGSAAARETLTVAHDQWVGYSGFFVAQAQGYFAQEDLDVKEVDFSVPGDSLPPLVAGHVDVALTTLYNLALLAGKGERSVVAIWLLDSSNGADAVLGGPGISTLAQLKGRKVAATTGEVNHLLLLKGLESAGLRESDIQLVNLNADDAGAALLARRVDAAVTWEPWVSRARETGDAVIYSSAEVPNLIMDAVVVQEETLRTRAGTLKRFLRALDRGLGQLREHPEQAQAQVAKALDIAPGDLPRMLAGDHLYSAQENHRILAPAGDAALDAVGQFLLDHRLIDRPLRRAGLLNGQVLP
jgi:NitT/TauT family transport system substrate-binding protein